MPGWSFKLEGKIFDGVKIITAGHVVVKKVVFDPNRGVCCAIVRFDVYGFKPFWELIFHYFISEAQGVCGASVLGDITTELKRALSVLFGLSGLTVSGATVVVTYRGAPTRSIDRS